MKDLRLKPVRRPAVPGYPARDYLREHPELLEYVPERWRGNELVLRVLGGVVCLLLASEAAANAQQPTAAAESRVAPIFEHGTGRGTFGCLVVNPPVFLTEDEARQVIETEGLKAGLQFMRDQLTLKGVTLPVTRQYMCAPVDDQRSNQKPAAPDGTDPLWFLKAKPKAREAPRTELVLDGYDPKLNVAYEFVSSSDYRSWKDPGSTCWSTVSIVGVFDAAKQLRSGLPGTGDGVRVGIFYDPVAKVPLPETGRGNEQNPETRWAESRKLGKELDAEQLRLQVRDFIAWLKAQGVI